jgi:hypothetical protein
MFFDFRLGPEHWPKNVELVDQEKATDMLVPTLLPLNFSICVLVRPMMHACLRKCACVQAHAMLALPSSCSQSVCIT